MAPALPVIGTQTVNEQTLLTVTNTATEPNIHAVTTGYSLISPLPGMSLDTNGIFTWTPGQSQSPGSNTVTVVATNYDNLDPVNPVVDRHQQLHGNRQRSGSCASAYDSIYQRVQRTLSRSPGAQRPAALISSRATTTRLEPIGPVRHLRSRLDSTATATDSAGAAPQRFYLSQADALTTDLDVNG